MGVELKERDFFRERFSEAELRNLMGDLPPSEIFSWNSPSFKKLGLKREELDCEALVRLMLGEPRMIRRPLIYARGQLVVGTDKKSMAQSFP